MLWIDPGWADEIAYLGRSQRPGGRAPDASTNTVAAHETPWEANGFILARRPRTRSAERAPCNDTSDFLRIDGRPVDQASRSDRDPYSPVIPRTPDGWSRSNSNPLTPTLPATRSKVFEHSRKCENPFYIRGFGLRPNLGEHSGTTPILANGYQDGYQMILLIRLLVRAIFGGAILVIGRPG
jgi:hypothetical protein